MQYHAIIAGGGPAGLAAALTLGRARKRVLLADSGPPRNARAVHVQNFVTRDGVTPADFRRIAREQLAPYPHVEVHDDRVEAVAGGCGAFDVRVGSRTVGARRVLLCTGMVDELPAIEGFAELWGRSIFQCPYCHGWEVRDQRFAWLAATPESLSFAVFLRGWTGDMIALTGGAFDVPEEHRRTLARARVGLEERPVGRLLARDDRLSGIELADGTVVERDVLFVHPPQRQVDLVRTLGLALDDKGFVRVDEATRETSVPGVYAAGDLAAAAQGGQGALLSAAAGTRAAAMLNHALTVELAASGALS